MNSGFYIQLHSQNENFQLDNHNLLLNIVLFFGTILAPFLYKRLRLVKEGTE
ncbi:hypothetical protein VCRA219O19_10379 [Vibrio crassostreae]|nr:hypothetical protein VCRA219O19_10379 [Vibrio crassostreae]